MAPRYLYNSIDANCGVQSPAYAVDSAPVRLTVTGLLAGQTIPILFRMSGDCLGPSGSPCARHLSYTTPLIRGGCPAALSDQQTQLVEVMPGAYELDMSAIPIGQPVAVLVEELGGLADSPAVRFVLPYTQCGPPVACPPVTAQGVVTTWG